MAISHKLYLARQDRLDYIPTVYRLAVILSTLMVKVDKYAVRSNEGNKE